MTSSPLPYASKVGDSRPAQGVTDHSGNVPTVEYDFFAPPPPEVGQLWSAESTLRIGRTPMPAVVRYGVIVGIPVAMLGAGFALSNALGARDGSFLFFTALVAAVTLIVLLFKLRFEARCTYVGAAGAAKLVAGPSREVAKSTVLSFNQAAELQTSQVRQSVNGVYTGTNYVYNWTDETGRSLMRLKGSYRAGRGKNPKTGDPFNFGRAAEIAWSNFFLDRAQLSLKEEGSIPFRVDKTRWVRVGPGFMEFHFGGDPVRVEKTEIAKVTLGSGVFRFEHKDAKWLSRAGKFSFNYGSMGNARVFLLALDKLMGYRWG